MSLAFLSNAALHRLLFLFLLLFWGYILKFAGVLPVDTVLLSYALVFLSIIHGIRCREFLKRLGGHRGMVLLLLFVVFYFFGSAFNVVVLGVDPRFVRNLLVLTLIFFVFVAVPEDRDVNFLIKYVSIIMLGLLLYFVIYVFLKGVHYSSFFLSSFQANYLILADVSAIAGLLFCMLRIPFFLKCFVAALVMVGLLFLGSRSSMVFYFVALALAFLIEFRGFGLLAKTKSVLFLSVALVALIALVLEQKERFYRLFSIFNITEDSSFKARNNLADQFWENVSEGWLSFLVGGGSETSGSYAHNLLSVWQFSGFFAFLATILLLCLAFVIVFSRPVFFRRILPVWFFCFLSCIFSRSIVSIVFPVLFSLSWIVVFSAFPKSDSRYRTRHQETLSRTIQLPGESR